MQGRELRGEDLVWNTDLIETKKLENLICQATLGLYSDSEVLEPLEDLR